MDWLCDDIGLVSSEHKLPMRQRPLSIRHIYYWLSKQMNRNGLLCDGFDLCLVSTYYLKR